MCMWYKSVDDLTQQLSDSVRLNFYWQTGTFNMPISKSKVELQEKKKLYHWFFIVKYSYLPRDIFKTYVEMHVTSRKLTLTQATAGNNV